MLQVLDNQLLVVQEKMKQLTEEKEVKQFGIALNNTQQEINHLIQLIKDNEGCSIKYSRRVKCLQADLKTQEKEFLQRADFQLLVLDAQRLNTLLQKDKVNQKMLKEITVQMDETCKKINQSQLKAQERKVYTDILKLIKISEEQVSFQPILRSSMIKSSYQSQQIQLEEINQVDPKDEEAIINILEGAQELQQIQQEFNEILHKQDEPFAEIEVNVQQVQTDLQHTQMELKETLYTSMLIRRKKIKMLFSGLFAVLGTYFGGIGLMIGTAIGLKLGSQVAKIDQSAVSHELKQEEQKQ